MPEKVLVATQRFARLEQRGIALMYRKVLKVEIDVSLLSLIT